MSGFRNFHARSQTACKWSALEISAADNSAISFTSAPAQNTLSLPVKTTQRIDSSASSSFSAPTSSSTIVEFRALRASGLLSLTVATAPSIMRAMVWYFSTPAAGKEERKNPRSSLRRKHHERAPNASHAFGETPRQIRRDGCDARSAPHRVLHLV